MASQILADLEDERAWKQRFAEKRDVIRRMAQEALDEISEARRRASQTCFDRVASHAPVLEVFLSVAPDVPIEARRAYRLFRINPSHPSLHFKKLQGEENIYSAEVGLNYRALGVWKDRESFGTGLSDIWNTADCRKQQKKSPGVSRLRGQWIRTPREDSAE